MADPLRLGLVGAGAIAQTYAKAMERSPLAVIAAVADIRPDAARAMAECVRGIAVARHEELTDHCDAVIVCTPPASHAAICRSFVERGIPVLCEKPLCIDLAEAQALRRLAAEHRVLLTMASKFRYVPDVIRARAIVTSRSLGEIIQMENVFTARVDMAARWNSDPAISGGGVLIDNGTHSVDIFRYLLGPIEQVLAVPQQPVQRIGVEDTAQLFLRSGDGVAGVVDLSWSFNRERSGFIDIYGTRGTVHVGWKGSEYRLYANATPVPCGDGYDKVQAIRAQVENFVQAVRGVEPLLIGIDDAVASVEAIRAAYLSMQRKSWVTIGEVRERIMEAAE